MFLTLIDDIISLLDVNEVIRNKIICYIQY